MIHLYCGDGKGKTTAAMGLALRMAGRGKRVVVAQFLKSADSGERRALAALPGWLPHRLDVPAGEPVPIALPDAGYVALVFARSGLGIKHGIAPANCVGVIDSDYRGEILVGLQNSGQTDYTVQPGDRIAQLMITPVVQAAVTLVEELDDTARGAGGFGSTGK